MLAVGSYVGNLENRLAIILSVYYRTVGNNGGNLQDRVGNIGTCVVANVKERSTFAMGFKDKGKPRSK